jgi:hypothetical protein
MQRGSPRSVGAKRQLAKISKNSDAKRIQTRREARRADANVIGRAEDRRLGSEVGRLTILQQLSPRTARFQGRASDHSQTAPGVADQPRMRRCLGTSHYQPPFGVAEGG